MLYLDFAARQKTRRNELQLLHRQATPVLPPETYTPALLDQIVPRVLELVYTAWDLAPFARDLGYEGDPFPWDEERRALLRAELDGIYAHLYGLNRDDFAYILEQFPIVKREGRGGVWGVPHGAAVPGGVRLLLQNSAREKLRSAVEEIEIHLTQLVVRRLHDDLSVVPAHDPGRTRNRRG